MKNILFAGEIKKGFLVFTALLIFSSIHAQHADKLMKALGFYKYGTTFLRPVIRAKYACNSVQLQPYLLVSEADLEPCRSLNTAGKIAFLKSPLLQWKILLPVKTADTLQSALLMKGNSVINIQGWNLLSSCSWIKGDQLGLKEDGQLTLLINEAKETWKDLFSWYESAH